MLTVDRAVNGWVLRYPNDADGSPVTIVVEEEPEHCVRGYVKVLQEVIEALGFVGSRYDAECVRVVVGPGDKYLTTEGWG